MQGLSLDACTIISQKMDCFYREMLRKYEEKKYEEKEYERLCGIFKSPKSIQRRDVEDALAWKYGKTHENLLNNSKYRRVIDSLSDGWSAFVDVGIDSGDLTFKYWSEKIGSAFITVAFVAHLIDPLEIPIVDQHTFRAVRYFLDLVGYRHGIKKSPGSLSEIHTLRGFVVYFSKMKKNVSQREFDKYLMMFGKHIAPR